MADKPIREQSALELLETHAKALEADNARLRAVAVAAKALVRTVERTHSLTLDVEIVSEPALTTLESTLAAAGYDMSDEELEQRLAHETESKPPREIWACVSKGISPPYVRFFESKAEMEAYEWRDDSVSPNRYRPAEQPTRDYGPPADHCEKHGLHRAFAGGCPQCYHEKHDLPRAPEKAKSTQCPNCGQELFEPHSCTL